jgi:flavin reductase (DIM6/NTAB) family NADH-FMN oxidoreductase RutF
MGLSAFNHTISIVGEQINSVNYVATYAWMCQCGYNEVIGLFGSQSDLAHKLKIGDVVGINACSKSMKDLANYIGSHHSHEIDKLQGVTYNIKDHAILLPDAKVEMVGIVKDIIHLKDLEEDFLVYFHIESYEEHLDKEFLLMSDL